VHLSFSSWWAGQTLLHLMHFLVDSCKSARTHHPPRFVRYLASSQEEFGVRTHRILRSEVSKITSVSCRPKLAEKPFIISHYTETWNAESSLEDARHVDWTRWQSLSLFFLGYICVCVYVWSTKHHMDKETRPQHKHSTGWSGGQLCQPTQRCR